MHPVDAAVIAVIFAVF